MLTFWIILAYGWEDLGIEFYFYTISEVHVWAKVPYLLQGKPFDAKYLYSRRLQSPYLPLI